VALALGVGRSAPAATLEIDAPLVFDGVARDAAPADGTFDSVATDLDSGTARIQNDGTPAETEDRIVLEFDLRGLAADLGVVSATLLLEEAVDDGPPLELYGAEGDGIASASDAQTGSLVSGPSGSFGDAAASTASVDVTDRVRPLHAAGASFAAFVILGGDVAGGDPVHHYQVASAEVGTAPRLRVVLEKLRKRVLSVSNHGADSPACGAKGTPCRSISRAIRNAQPGDEILVGPGYYGDLDRDGSLGEPGEEPFEGNSGGCQCMIHVDKAVAIRSRDGAAATVIDGGGLVMNAVVIDAPGVELGRRNAGFAITGGSGTGVAAGVSATDLSLAGHVVVGNGIGVSVSGDRGRISDNRVIGNTLGMQLFGTGTLVEGNAALANEIGLFATGQADFTLRRNVAIGNAGVGFFLAGPALRLEECSAIGNGEAGILVDQAGVEIERCNLVGNSRLAIGTHPNCGLLNVSTHPSRIAGTFFGGAAGPGDDPADGVCDESGSITAVEGMSPKPIAVRLRTLR